MIAIPGHIVVVVVAVTMKVKVVVGWSHVAHLLNREHQIRLRPLMYGATHRIVPYTACVTAPRHVVPHVESRATAPYCVDQIDQQRPKPTDAAKSGQTQVTRD